MEVKKELSPSAAILDFEKKYFKGLFDLKKGVAVDPGYKRCHEAIRSARDGTITFERAARILTKYAPPGVYSITEKIETI